MTELDLELPDVASELIEEFGKAVTFNGIGNAAYDPATGGVVTVNPAGLTVKAIIEPDKGQAVRAGLIEGADFKLTIAAQSLPTSSTTEDKVSFDGATYKVVLVKKTYSGELVAIYEIWVSSI